LTSTEKNTTAPIFHGQKIAPWLVALLVGSAITATSVSLQEFYRASRPDECAITIAYAYRYGPSALNMNFKTKFDDNWNFEAISDERMHFKARIFIAIMFYYLTIFAFSIFRWYVQDNTKTWWRTVETYTKLSI